MKMWTTMLDDLFPVRPRTPDGLLLVEPASTLVVSPPRQVDRTVGMLAAYGQLDTILYPARDSNGTRIPTGRHKNR